MLYRKGSTLFGEISNQPTMWKHVLEVMSGQREALDSWFRAQNFGQVIYLTTSELLPIAISGARVTQLVSGLNSVAFPYSEILYGRRAPYDVRIRTLVVVLSRPGLANELTWAVDKLKALDPKAQYLVLEAGPPEASYLGTNAASFPEVKDAAKLPICSASALLLACLLTVSVLAKKTVLWDELARLPEIVSLNVKPWQAAAQHVFLNKPTHIAFLGSGPFVGVAQYAASLMQQMAALPCQGTGFIEYSHGDYVCLNNLMMVVGIISNTFRTTEEKIFGDLAVTRASRVIIAEEGTDQLNRRCEELFELKSGVSEITRVLLVLPALQMFAFYMSMAKGVNPDNPKHLDHPAIVLKECPGTKAGTK